MQQFGINSVWLRAPAGKPSEIRVMWYLTQFFSNVFYHAVNVIYLVWKYN